MVTPPLVLLVTRRHVVVPLLWLGIFLLLWLPSGFMGSLGPVPVGLLSALVATGVVSGLVAVLKNHRPAGWLGLTSWLPIPVLHVLATSVLPATAVVESVMDLFGLACTLLMAGVATAAATQEAAPGSRWTDGLRRAGGATVPPPTRRPPAVGLIHAMSVMALAVGLIVPLWPHTEAELVGWSLHDTHSMASGPEIGATTALAAGTIEPVALTPSPGLYVVATGEGTYVVVPAARYSASRVVGALWILAAIALWLVPHSRWAGALLLGAAAAIPILLWVGGTHGWYWSTPHLFVAGAAVGGAGAGAWLLMPPGPSWIRVLGGLVGLGAAGVFLIATGLGAASANYVNDPSSWHEWADYHGDYLVMGLHLVAVTGAAFLAAVAGALTGSERSPAGEAAPPAPARPRPSALTRAALL